MSETIFSAKYLEPAIWVLLAWLLREMYMASKKKATDQDSATKENTAAINSLSKEMIKLEGKLDHFSSIVTPLLRLPEDVNALHAKVRVLLKDEQKF